MWGFQRLLAKGELANGQFQPRNNFQTCPTVKVFTASITVKILPQPYNIKHKNFHWHIQTRKIGKKMESLTVTTIQSTINDIITKQDSKYLQGLKEKGLVLRQAVTESQWRELLAFPSTDSSASSSSSWKISDLPPYFFGIGLYRENENGNAPSENSNDKTTTTTLVGMVTFYMAYSTWDGRCVFLDKFEYPKTGDSDDDEAMEKGILRPLAKIAVDLGADRLCWHVSLSFIADFVNVNFPIVKPRGELFQWLCVFPLFSSNLSHKIRVYECLVILHSVFVYISVLYSL